MKTLFSLNFCFDGKYTIKYVVFFFRYKIDQMAGNKGFIVDLKILICFDFNGKTICIPTNDGLHLLKDQEIPLCDQNTLIDFNSEYSLSTLLSFLCKFSMTICCTVTAINFAGKIIIRTIINQQLFSLMYLLIF
jgi:hypothetical protein